MPPRGVRKGTKRERQYEHIKDTERKSGVSLKRAEEIAARTVNKERARRGEAKTSSPTSTKDISSGRRGGLRSGKPGPTRAHPRTALPGGTQPRVKGRSRMNKAQLQRAVDEQKALIRERRSPARPGFAPGAAGSPTT